MPESDLEMEKENLAVLVPHGLNSDGKIRTLEKELEMTREKLMASEQEVTKLKGNLSEVISENADQLRRLHSQVAEQRVELANNASKISFLVNQLEMAKEKLERSEEENTKLKCDLAEIVSESTQQLSDQLEASRNDVLHLKAQLDSGKRHALELEDMYRSKLLDQECEIKKINSEYQGAKEHFLLEKEQLQSAISSLSEQLTLLEAMKEKQEMRNKTLEDELIQCKAQEACCREDSERLKSELDFKDELVQTLNKDLDGFKLKYDMLMTEKDEINATLQTLKAVLSSRADQIQQLEDNVKQLHSKCLDLNAGSESAEKLIDELRLRVVHLEKEVDMQNAVISDRAEEKREAIRQLCFSLEHYRNGYQLLREAYIEKKEANHFCLIRFP